MNTEQQEVRSHPRFIVGSRVAYIGGQTGLQGVKGVVVQVFVGQWGWTDCKKYEKWFPHRYVVKVDEKPPNWPYSTGNTFTIAEDFLK